MFKEMFYTKISRKNLTEVLKSTPTPAYIYFKSLILERIQELKSCAGSWFQLHYAVKANPHPEILQIMAQNRIGVDVSSLGELKRAQTAGIPASQIEFTGPGKGLDELTYAIQHHVGSINVESLAELEAILGYCRQSNLSAKIGLRLNPAVPTLKIGLKMAGETQFGIPESQLPEVFQLIHSNPAHLDFQGLHVHIGSQILDANVIVQNIQAILELARQLEEKFEVEIQKINFGGGWGINYFPHQQPLNLTVIRTSLQNLFELRTEIAGTRLLLEPGRFWVGESGIYVTRVLYRKPEVTRDFLIVDGGLHQNYLIAGGMGQVIKRNFEMDVLRHSPKPVTEFKFDVAGKLCTPQDILATNCTATEDIQPGDLVIFFNCGAYGYSASPLFFLSHPEPGEYWV